jgi:hypothetical protein
MGPTGKAEKLIGHHHKKEGFFEFMAMVIRGIRYTQQKKT